MCEFFVWVESFPPKLVSIAVNWYKAPARFKFFYFFFDIFTTHFHYLRFYNRFQRLPDIRSGQKRFVYCCTVTLDRNMLTQCLCAYKSQTLLKYQSTSKNLDFISLLCFLSSLFSTVTFENKQNRLLLLTWYRAKTWVIIQYMTFMSAPLSDVYHYSVFFFFFHWHSDGLLHEPPLPLPRLVGCSADTAVITMLNVNFSCRVPPWYPPELLLRGFLRPTSSPLLLWISLWLYPTMTHTIGNTLADVTLRFVWANFSEIMLCRQSWVTANKLSFIRLCRNWTKLVVRTWKKWWVTHISCSEDRLTDITHDTHVKQTRNHNVSHGAEFTHGIYRSVFLC